MGLIPGLSIITGLSLLFVLVLALRFFTRSPVFLSPKKTNISKFQFDPEFEGHRFVSHNRLLRVTIIKQTLTKVDLKLVNLSEPLIEVTTGDNSSRKLLTAYL